MSAAVEITGLSSPTFATAVNNIKAIYENVKGYFAPGMMDKWNTSSFGAHIAIDASNQYFTRRSDAMDTEELEFGLHVDPLGVMKREGGPELTHVEENVVEYYQRISQEGRFK